MSNCELISAQQVDHSQSVRFDPVEKLWNSHRAAYAFTEGLKKFIKEIRVTCLRTGIGPQTKSVKLPSTSNLHVRRKFLSWSQAVVLFAGTFPMQLDGSWNFLFKIFILSYLAMSLANNNLLEGLSFPKVYSDRLNVSIKVCPTTVSDASKQCCRWTSNKQSGLWINCIQNLSINTLVFHAWMMSGSVT